MARALWKGSLRFGLVEIQVGLYTAERSNELSFTYLDRKDLSPVGYERINKSTGQKVPWDRIVRGFKHPSGRYVVVTEEDLKNANVEATQSVDILAFVPADAIGLMYYDKPYYLLPSGKSSKSYVLLRDALSKSGRVGIGKVVIRTREHLAAVSVRDDLLVLDLLRYAHELVAPDEIKPSGMTLKADVNPQEMKMAGQLIQGMSDEWRPDQYADTYREDLLALIDKKVKSGELTKTCKTAAPAERPARAGTVVDLMPLLRESLERAQGPRSGASTAAGEKASRRSRAAGSAAAGSSSHSRSRTPARSRHRAVRRKTRRAS